MQSLRRLTSAVAAGLLLLGVAATPSPVAAKPAPGTPSRGFRLFARSLGALTINRIYCGLASNGNICTDSTNSSTIGGGFWPKGTADQYVFNSGLQIAGIIQGSKPANPWGGDVVGAFFFNARGGGNGEEVQPIYNSVDGADNASWPAAAKVPTASMSDPRVGPPLLYNPLLQGRTNASQGDVWWLSWDGNPDLNASRTHPMGVLVEQRGLGWNFPAGNEDIIYFVYTFYNITSTDPADYAAVRPELQPILMAKAKEFQTRNNAKFNVTLPAKGYTIGPLFAAFGTDPDVATAGVNYSTVNLPFALGYAYEHTFTQEAGWSFDSRIFSGDQFAGNGFFGVKYLRSPTGPGAIQLFSNTQNGTGVQDPNSSSQLYRYLSGTPNASDGACDPGVVPATDHFCFIAQTTSDTRFFQSSSQLTLPPGAFGSIVVAYIFAAPTTVRSFTPGPSADVKPGDPRVMANLTTGGGVNMIDSLTGFRSYCDLPSCGGNGDGKPQQSEFNVAPRSLLAKALTAQAVFNQAFLLPFAPEAPNFYLVPGDNQVTVFWQPSPTEDPVKGGDPFFAVAQQPTVIDPVTGLPIANSLYDPNYRSFDVEGYRVYRGRVDSPNSLTLLAQFDYAGTTIKDFSGQVNPTTTCAPELAVYTSCPTEFDNPFPPAGVARTKFVEIPLVGQLTQVQLGGRSLLANGTVIYTALDTAASGNNSGAPNLSDTGVPFVYVDKGVRNNFRYFYSVTAFDLNSVQSTGYNFTTLESARNTKSVTPVPQASNVDAAVLISGIFGDDGKKLDPTSQFSLDPNTGRFLNAPPPTGAISGVFQPLVPALLPAVSLSAVIDSAVGHDAATDPTICTVSNQQGLCTQYFVTFDNNGTKIKSTAVVAQPILDIAFNNHDTTLGLGQLAVQLDPVAAQRFGIPAAAAQAGQFKAAVGATFSLYGRSSAGENFYGRRNTAQPNTSPGGSRWFDGANETLAHPAIGIRVGHLGGVDTIFAPLPHIDANPAVAGTQAAGGSGLSVCIQMQRYFMNMFARQADIEVTWAGGGQIAKVRDVTHNVDVPFKSKPEASYGFVTDNDGNGKIDWHDFDFLPGVAEAAVNDMGFCDYSDVTVPATAQLTAQPTIGPVSTSFGAAAAAPAVDVTAFPTTGQGFGLYINGQPFIFQLTGGTAPAAGTKWTLRSYMGTVTATNGQSATPSAYKYVALPSTPAVPGLQVKFTVSKSTQVLAATDSGLSKVHTVPDPYYVTNEFESTTDTKIIRFVNLPAQCIIRIYSSSGVLVSLLEHNSGTYGGSEVWNVRNRNNQVVASGVYFYHIEAGDARKVGRFTVVNFAQ